MEKWVKKTNFGQKRPNMGQKNQIWKNFGDFLKDQKISTYGKNQKKIRKRLEEMGQKEHFLPKTTTFWPKSRKQEFLPGIFFRHFLKDQKISSYAKNQKNLK